jgi:hypothetical protein
MIHRENPSLGTGKGKSERRRYLCGGCFVALEFVWFGGKGGWSSSILGLRVFG